MMRAVLHSTFLQNATSTAPGRRFYPYPKDTPDRCTSPRQAWPLGQAALSLATRPPPFLEASRGGGYEGDDKKLACGRFMDLDH